MTLQTMIINKIKKITLDPLRPMVTPDHHKEMALDLEIWECFKENQIPSMTWEWAWELV